MVDLMSSGLFTLLLVFLTGVWTVPLICTNLEKNQWIREISSPAILIAGFVLRERSVFRKNLDLSYIMRFLGGSVFL